MSNLDVYAYGMVSTSTLYQLAEKYPEPDCNAEFTDVFPQTGGEAANSSNCPRKIGSDGPAGWKLAEINGIHPQERETILKKLRVGKEP